MGAYDGGTLVDIAILDFNKAFDVVSHRKILVKLNYYRVYRQYIKAWIANFLQDGQQAVLVEGKGSDSVKVSSGVSQGTCLGPVLFLTYINDIVNNITCQLCLFADDASLYTSIVSYTDQYRLQRDLDTLEIWASIWDMHFNASKCYILSVCKTEDPKFYHL